MALKTSKVAEKLSKQANIKPQLVLVLKGIPFYFGALPVTTMGLFDEGHEFDEGLFFDTPIEDPKSRNLISFESPTTNNLTQQIYQDKESASSIPSFTVKLVNKNGILNEIFRKGNYVDDILSTRGKIMLGFKGGTFPDDFVTIFRGMVDQFDSGSGNVVLSLAHPDAIKRQEFFIKVTTQLTAPIFNEVSVESINEFDNNDAGTGTDVTMANTLFFKDINIQDVTGLQVGNQFTVSGSAIGGNNKTVTAIELGSVTDGTYIKVAEALTTEKPSPAKISVDSNIMLVDSTVGLIEPGDIIESYVKIDDELMLVNSFTGNSIAVTRNQLGTVLAEHEVGADVSSFYRLVGKPIEIALKLMLSDGEQSYSDAYDAASIVQYDPTTIVQRAIFFENIDIQDEENLIAGDDVLIQDATNPANNISAKVVSTGKLDSASYVVIDQNLTIETSSPAVVSFRSQYNVLNEGMGLSPTEVDIEGHLLQENLYGSGFPTLYPKLKDTINGKDFLEKEIYFPSGLYSIPRKAQSSCKMSAVPFTSEKTFILNESSVENLGSLRVRRSINKNFYNAIVYKYDEDVLEEKLKKGTVTYSNESANRIKFGSKPLTIEAKAFIDNVETRSFIAEMSDRFLDRFKFAAEYIDGIELVFQKGFLVEVGDVLLIGGPNVQIPDLDLGQGTYPLRMVEIVNKSYNLKQGKITIDVLATAFNLNGRYGVISMSSLCDAGSTLTKLKLKTPFDSLGEYLKERDKYIGFEGQKFRVRSEDYTSDQEFTYVEPDQSNQDFIKVSGLVAIPDEDSIVENVDYDSASDQQKTEFVFMDPQEEVTLVISSFKFEVSNIERFFVGSVIHVHNEDYTRDSEEVEVIEIDGDEITTEPALGFVPVVGDFVELIGFVDEGLPYRII